MVFGGSLELSRLTGLVINFIARNHDGVFVSSTPTASKVWKQAAQPWYSPASEARDSRGAGCWSYYRGGEHASPSLRPFPVSEAGALCFLVPFYLCHSGMLASGQHPKGLKGVKAPKAAALEEMSSAGQSCMRCFALL